MTRSSEASVTRYLAAQPPKRRKVLSAVRKVIREHLPKGYVETMNWGMISYEVPLETYPDTYNGQPLMYAGLAARKEAYAIHLLGIYGSDALAKKLTDAFAKLGMKPNVGKSCIRFKKLEDIPLDTIGEIVATISPDKWIDISKQARRKA